MPRSGERELGNVANHRETWDLARSPRTFEELSPVVVHVLLSGRTARASIFFQLVSTPYQRGSIILTQTDAEFLGC